MPIVFDDTPFEQRYPHSRELGNRVRAWRMEKQLLLIQMANQLDVKPSELSGWELGREPWPEDMRARVEKMIGEDW